MACRVSGLKVFRAFGASSVRFLPAFVQGLPGHKMQYINVLHLINGTEPLGSY